MATIEFDPALADVLDLNRLSDGTMPGISARVGQYYAEAAGVCLEQQDHRPGVTMQIDGACKHDMQVVWSNTCNDEQLRRSWNDEQVATETGAYGVAAVLVDGLTEYTVLERSRKGTGFDYWLGKKGSDAPLFQDKARLEVSGIRRGSHGVLEARTRVKTEQMNPSDGVLPGVAVVVEFGSPRTRVRTK